MAKRMLVETRLNSLQLCESSTKSVRPGYLCTISGPCADYDHPTRNGNFYSRKLWENVFNSDIIKESLDDRILIGELDHPLDRLETKAVNACLVMTDKEFHDDEGLLYGTFDVLDTPNGRILKSLLDYGCKIGVSSRGEGDVEVKDISTYGETNFVDEDNFEFVAFDAVVLPAVKAAKPTLRESLDHKSLRESLQKEVDSATTASELDLIKKVVEATDLPDADSLLESVNNKSQKLQSGTTGSSALVEDLELANNEILRLKEEISRLTSEVTTCKSRYSGQIKSRQKLVGESVRQKKEIKDLNEKYSASVFESLELSRKVENLENSLSSSDEKSRRLEDEIRSTSSKLSQSESRVRDLEESLSQSQKLSKKKIEEVKSLKSQIESLKKTSTSKLTESLSKESKLKESYNKVKTQLTESKTLFCQIRNAYVVERCKRLGVDPAKVLESVKTCQDISKVNKLIESYVDKVERHRSVPIVEDSLIKLLEEGQVRFSEGQIPRDEDYNQTLKFMEEADKFF